MRAEDFLFEKPSMPWNRATFTEAPPPPELKNEPSPKLPWQQFTESWKQVMPAYEEAAKGTREFVSELPLGKQALKAIDYLSEAAQTPGLDFLPMMGVVKTPKPNLSWAKQTLPEGLSANEQIGTLSTLRKVRPSFAAEIDKEGKYFLNWVEKHRGNTAIHPNQKTGLSMDFSTDCPNRAAGLGPCAYCYVEHSRVAKDLGLGFMHGKKITENPYQHEILGMSKKLVNELNRDGGMRTFSFGDYRPQVDTKNMAMALEDASQKGLYIKAITKEPQLVKDFGNHPNLRVNISIDNVPKAISNAPTIDEAFALKQEYPNVKVRAVALNEAEAVMYGKDPRVDVVTLYHGLTGDNLKKIVMAQNPRLVEHFGSEEALSNYLNTWENMPPKSKAFQRITKQFPKKVCCQSGACSRDRTKCGFGIAALGLIGVHLPEYFEEQ